MLGKLLLTALLCVGLAGCPRQAETPERGDGSPCTVLADCNGGQVCGEAPLTLCVDERCEDEPSVVRPCTAGPDAGL